jgi:AmiR/NasT family two-component response regulator
MPAAPSKPPRETPALLRDLRSLQVVVFHPDDTDGQELISQLHRIGCQVRAFWPPPERLPDDTGLIFFAVRPDALAIEPAWLRREPVPPVIAVVNYENPVIIEAVLRLNAQGIVASPVKSFGLLSAAVVALAQAERSRESGRYVAKLEQRLAGLRKIAKAKSILMQSRSIGEEEAYRLIREQSMAKRVTTEEIADAIINANEILAFEGRNP